MFPIQPLRSFDQLKLLADPRRLKILRLLMAEAASLTQLGRALGQHPARVRHHLKQLESGGLVTLVETRSEAGVVEKFYRARAGGLLLQELILPESDRPALVFSGSHDLAVELLIRDLAPHLALLAMPVGSLDGLIALRQDLCHLSGCHLLDANGEYNLPFVRRFFPDRVVTLVTLAHRQQGLLVAAGNPRGIRGLDDLARPDLTFINRNPGSGTRLWLDRQLQQRGISPSALRGFENAVRTHTECARAVQRGQADLAVGLQAAAHAHGLGFLPLFDERYDLVFPQAGVERLTPLLDQLQSSAFRRQVAALSGYEATHTGEHIPL
ncbi:MAG: helix-turn-helix domain-containing protein [Anaerolineales bacterium]|nr:helix-turn-helix domain-containing protein [Anaerolineales bacterium]